MCFKWIPSVPQSEHVPKTGGQDYNLCLSRWPSVFQLMLFTLPPTSLLSHLNTPWSSEASSTGYIPQAQAQRLSWPLLRLTPKGPSILHSFCAERISLQCFHTHPTVSTAFICCYEKPWTWHLLILGPKDSGLKNPQPSRSLPERVLQPAQLHSLSRDTKQGGSCGPALSVLHGRVVWEEREKHLLGTIVSFIPKSSNSELLDASDNFGHCLQNPP